MKNKPCSCLLLSSIMFLSALTPLMSQSDSSTSPGAEAPLTGSALKAEDIVADTEIIFVGKVDEVLGHQPTAPGMWSGLVNVTVTQALKGSVSGQIYVSVHTLSDRGERGPKIGSSYIFWVYRDHKLLLIKKLLPATDESIANIKALLAKPK